MVESGAGTGPFIDESESELDSFVELESELEESEDPESVSDCSDELESEAEVSEDTESVSDCSAEPESEEESFSDELTPGSGSDECDPGV